MDVIANPVVCPSRARSAEVVRVPVPTILYLQAMVENGQGDRPKPMGPTLPIGHVCYRQ
jgi:hypothetical protein